MIRIVEMRRLDDFRLFLRFDDGSCGEVDIRRIIPFRGVFARLADPDQFARVTLDEDWGTIRWGEDLDLAPECLRENLEPWTGA